MGGGGGRVDLISENSGLIAIIVLDRSIIDNQRFPRKITQKSALHFFCAGTQFVDFRARTMIAINPLFSLMRSAHTSPPSTD